MDLSRYNEQRRQLLKALGVFFASYSVDANAESLSLEMPTASEQETLSAFLDVLIPRDQQTGSATDLQVDKQIWSVAESSQDFRRLIVSGCDWLNETGGPPFHQLDDEQQYSVVAWMSESDWQYTPRRFYDLLRSTALSLYYSQSAAWEGLPIKRPPQPEGYPPPWR